MVEIRVLRDLKSVMGIELLWESLLKDTDCFRAFGCPLWYLNSIKFLSTQVTPYVVTAWRDDKLVGVLPLVCRRTAKSQHNYLTPADISLTDYFELVARKDDFETAMAIVTALFQGNKGGDGIIFANLDSCGVLHSVLNRYLLSNFHPSRMGYVCPFLNWNSGWNDFLRWKGGSYNKNLNRYKRKLKDEGLVLSTQLNKSQTENLAKDFLRLHFMRMHDAQISSIFAQQPHQDFLLATLPHLVSESHMKVVQILRGEVVEGVDLQIESARAIGLWQGGFNPSIEKFSPGRLMFTDGIKGALESGRNVDFFRGAQDFKDLHANGARQLVIAGYQYSPALKALSYEEIHAEFFE